MTGESEHRNACRRALLAAGIAEANVDEIVDLVFHARSSALAAVFDIARRASRPQNTIAVLTTVSGVLHHDFTKLGDEIAAAAPSLGGRVERVRVNLDPDAAGD